MVRLQFLADGDPLACRNMGDLPLSLAAEVRRLRKDREMSREGLAFAAGVSSSLIERIELRNHVPKLDALRAVAKALNVPLSQLIEATNGEAA